MAIQPIDDDVSKARAAQRLRSPDVTPEEKVQYTALYGAEFVNKALSYTPDDINEVKIDDVSYDSAKKAGEQTAKDSTGYDGGKSGKSIGSATMSAAGGAAAIGTVAGIGFLNKTVSGGTTTIGLANAGTNSATNTVTKSGGKTLGMYVAAALAIATAAYYWIAKPNKEQVEATQTLLQNDLPQGQAALETAQSDAVTATEETTALTDEAEKANEEAQDKIDENKIIFDTARLKAEEFANKARSGVRLTSDEKVLFQQNKDLMTKIGGTGEDDQGEIGKIQSDTAETVGEKLEDIEGYQEAYDGVAETIAEVQGVTDFAEGFDEATRTMCYVEGGSQTLNAASGAWAGAKLCSSGFWNWALGIASLAASASSGMAAAQQFSYASKVSDEIDVRRETQELGAETDEVYNTELENFVANTELTEEFNVLEIPDDLTTPEDLVLPPDCGEGGGDPLAAAASGAKPNEENANNGSPLTAGSGSGGSIASPLTAGGTSTTGGTAGGTTGGIIVTAANNNNDGSTNGVDDNNGDGKDDNDKKDKNFV